MNVLFFTINYKSGMYRQLADEFSLHGHRVTFVAPTYEGENRIEDLNPHQVLLFRAHTILNVGLIKKGIANLFLPYQCKSAVKKLIDPQNIDLILMSTPPLGYYLSIEYLNKTQPGIKFYLILRDIHPEGAKFVGLDKYKPLYNHFRSMEKSIYAHANKIGCMSPHSVKFIQGKNPEIDKNKVEVLPNWGKIMEATPNQTNILKKYGLTHKFMVVYGGNMGIAQNLDIFIQLAQEKKKYHDVVFLFVGNGTEYKRLQKLAEDLGINNILFINSLPPIEYDELIRSCHVGIISLHPRAFFANIPSKTIGYFAAKVPVLASVDSVTDYGEYILESSRAGLWSLATDFRKLSDNFDILYKDSELRKEMGENGYNYFMTHWTVDKTYAQIVKSIMNEN